MIFSGMGSPQAGAGLAALGAAAVLTEVMRRVALRYGLVDQLAGHKTHRVVTPHMGGIAIVMGTLVAVALYLPAWCLTLGAVMGGAVVVAALGFIDDLKPLSPLARLQVEAGVATAVVLAGVRFAAFGATWDGVVTVVWIVLITNSFNLLDNMDGVAATIGAATAICLAIAALAQSRQDYAAALLALSAACVGFLVHNWSPARIFMGDCGALFLGFVISTMSVLVPSSQAGPSAFLATLLFTLIPLLDTVLVLISRGMASRPLLLGGTDHVSHRLRRLGLSPAQTALTLLALTVVVSLMGVLLVCRLLPLASVLFGVLPAAVVLMLVLLKVPTYAVQVEDGHRESAPQSVRHDELGAAQRVVALAPLPLASEPGTSRPRTDW